MQSVQRTQPARRTELAGLASQSLAARARALTEAALGGPGETAPELRRAIAADAAIRSGRDSSAAVDEPPSLALPVPLAAYLDKIRRHAYRITDADVAALRAIGYSEDAIFELTLAAAVGAGQGRLERGLAVIDAAASSPGEPSPCD